MSDNTDILASVVLGVAGFFLPGIFKSVISRRKGMTMCAKEMRDTFVYDSALDPLSMLRWFGNPESMQEADQAVDASSTPQEEPSKQTRSIAGWLIRKLWLPLVLALSTQVALIMLQLATTRKIVGVQGTTGRGVTFVSPDSSPDSLAEFTQRASVSRCKPAATVIDSLTSITTCFSTSFLEYGVSSLSNDKYLFRVIRTFARQGEEDMISFGVQIMSEIFIREVQVTPRILSRHKREAYVSVNEDNVTASNEALWDLAESTLFAGDEACFRLEETSVWYLTEYQTIWTKEYDCSGPPYALGNNFETSSRFNTFAGVVADAFRVEGTSTYYADATDAGIATATLDPVEMEWATSSERVLSDGYIFLILVVVIALKLIVDSLFGEDVLYKATFLVAEAAGQPYSASFLNLHGKLKYKGRGYLRDSDTECNTTSLAEGSDSSAGSSPGGEEEEESLQTEQAFATENDAIPLKVPAVKENDILEAKGMKPKCSYVRSGLQEDEGAC